MLGKFRITGYKNYITKEGDTFDALSLSMYDDEKYDYVIRHFNPDYCDVIIFDAFVKLRIPVFEIIESPDTLPPWRQKQ